jgi:hypothetical protein
MKNPIETNVISLGKLTLVQRTAKAFMIGIVKKENLRSKWPIFIHNIA